MIRLVSCILGLRRILAGFVSDIDSVVTDADPSFHTSKTYIVTPEVFDQIVGFIERKVPASDEVLSHQQAVERIGAIRELIDEIAVVDKLNKPRYRSVRKILEVYSKTLSTQLDEDKIVPLTYEQYRALMLRDQDHYQKIHDSKRTEFDRAMSNLLLELDPQLVNKEIQKIIETRYKQLRPLFKQGQDPLKLQQIVREECLEALKEQRAPNELNLLREKDETLTNLRNDLLSIFDAPTPNHAAYSKLANSFDDKAHVQQWLGESNIVKKKYKNKQIDRGQLGDQLVAVYNKIQKDSGVFNPLIARLRAMTLKFRTSTVDSTVGL